MDDNEIQRLAAMGSSLRPDWPARSLRTFIERNLGARAYGDVAVALAWLCTRTKTDTPRLILEAGPWWKAAGTEGSTAARPPTKQEACATCGRRETEHTGPVLGDHRFVPLVMAKGGRTTAPDDLRSRIQPTVTFGNEESHE